MFLQEIHECAVCNKPLKTHPKITTGFQEQKLKCDKITVITKYPSDVETLERIAWSLIDIVATKVDVSELIPILATHPSADIRLAFARALDSLTFYGYDVSQWLRQLASDPEEEVASRVLWCLPSIAYLRPSLVFPIFDVLMTRSIEIKIKCLKMLSEIPHDKVDLNPFLVRAISEPKRSLRDMTGKIMLHLSSNGINICTAIKVALHVSYPLEFKIATVRALVILLTRFFKNLKEEAFSLLSHEEEKIKATAARILPILASKGFNVEEHVISFLKDPSPTVRSQLAWILPELADARISRKLMKTVLDTLARDENPQVVVELVYRLPDLKERGYHIDPLLQLLTQRTELDIRVALCSQLARLSYSGMNIVDLTDRYLHDTNVKVRKMLARILPRIGGKTNLQAFHRFRTLAEDQEPEVKAEIINQLERFVNKCLNAQVPIDDIYQGLIALSSSTTPEQRVILSKIARQLFNKQFIDESQATLLLMSTEGFV